ncbi:MAG: nucleoside deaminase [Candidatus Aenigmarchaeota archaeon]|nr:nucleoside deaminase [Candidatus Aenigmarchaeota archaeon]
MKNQEIKYLKHAIELAKESVKKGGFPAGAVVIKGGKVVSEGISIGNILHDPTSHAETAAIREACKKLNTSNLEGCTLYESLQSCVMCFSVAYWAGISRIVYASKKTSEMISKFYYEGSTDNKKLNKENNREIELIYVPDLGKDSLDIVREWENSNDIKTED